MRREDIEKLVRAILLEMLRNGGMAARTLVLLPCGAADEQRLEAWRQQSALTLLYDAAFPCPAGQDECITVSDIASVSGVLSRLDEFERVVCLAPPLALVNQLLSEDDSSPFARILLHAALCGKPVAIQSPLWESTSRPPYWQQRLQRMQSGLKAMGFALDTGDATATKTASPASRALVTEETINALHQSGTRELPLAPGALITPLARDRAWELGIRLS